MQYAVLVSSTNLYDRSNVAAEIVRNLMLTPRLQRAALLAHAGLPNIPTLTGEEFMPALAALADDTLHELETAAAWSASSEPMAGTSMKDERRLDYLEQVNSLYKDVAADASLAQIDKQHLLRLISTLAEALREAPHQGDAPIELAAKSIVGDAVVNKDLWSRLANNRGAQRLAKVTAGLLILLGSVGGYPGAKELVTDVFPSPPAVAPLQDDGHTEVLEAEVVADEEAEG